MDTRVVVLRGRYVSRSGMWIQELKIYEGDMYPEAGGGYKS
ncbi:hypothetical protein ACQCVP_14930 [Rossellomorea vietnamensis]